MILLDTNAFIWLLGGEPSLGPLARGSIEAARDEGGVGVSAISMWEISMLVRKKKLLLGDDTLKSLEAFLTETAIRVEPLRLAIAVDAERLPGKIQRDPADRMIVSTARHLACPVVTSDREMLAYADQGHVQAIDARL